MADNNTTQQQGALKKDLRQVDIWALALGAIIGWGCFVLPGTSFLPKAGPIGTALGLGIGAFFIMFISLSYGYLIQKFPVSGGEFVYADFAFGRKHAFICGWMIVLAYWTLIPLNSTAIALISRYLFPGIIQVGKLYSVAGWEVYLGEVLVASCFIAGIGYMNIRGIKSAGWFQTVVAILLAGSIIFATVGVLRTKPDIATNFTPAFQTGKSPIACVAAIIAYCPYCFVGFDCIPQAAEEYNFSHKKALRLMLLAIGIAGILYIAVALITAVVDPWQELLAENPFWATGQQVEKAIGRIGVMFIGIAMACAVLSGMNAFYISSSRLMYAMSIVHALPPSFGKIDPKTGTPKNAIMFCMILALIAPWFGRQILVWICDMTSVGAAMGFLYTTSSAAKIAYQNGHKGQSALGVIGACMSAVFLLLSFIKGSPGFLSNESFIILFIWIGIGIFFFMKVKGKYLTMFPGMKISEILKLDEY